jgi:hypothetical protein
MMELIHMTAAYSNAVLVAILPQVSDFAKKLDLPVQQPITVNQVVWSKSMPYKDMIEGAVILTNHYWFAYDWHGYVNSFRLLDDNWFYEKDPATNWLRYVGKDAITTNEAIVLARDTLRKLGYEPELLHADGPPSVFQGPVDLKNGSHIPYCEIRWESPEPKTLEEQKNRDSLEFQINLEKKTVVGMAIVSGKIKGTPPKIGVEPELESDYQKRMGGKMFGRTNAPPHWISNRDTNAHPASPPPGQEMKQE